MAISRSKISLKTLSKFRGPFLSARPGRKAKVVSEEQYDALKRDLEEKERALAELSVELAVLRKKTNGGTWER